MIYKVIKNEDFEDLVDEVNRHIRVGWKPQGGVSHTLNESDDYRYQQYTQAMVKEKEKFEKCSLKEKNND